MIFGRKKKSAADEAEVADVAMQPESEEPDTLENGAVETEDAGTEDAGTEDAGTQDAGTQDAGTQDAGTEDAGTEDAGDADDAGDASEDDRWAAFDTSRDWREEGPFDISEVDVDSDDTERLDFGALIITPMPDCEIRLQVTEDTEQIIAALLVKGESALELSAYAAPRTPGMWAEIRDEIIEGTQAAGGTADCVEGPFGTELVRNLPVQTPGGQLAFQPSRTWVAEGPRWLLRGVLFGEAALTDEHDDDLVGPFFDAFSDVIVRRDDAAMPVGDVLALTLPAELQAAAEAQQAQAQQAEGES